MNGDRVCVYDWRRTCPFGGPDCYCYTKKGHSSEWTPMGGREGRGTAVVLGGENFDLEWRCVCCQEFCIQFRLDDGTVIWSNPDEPGDPSFMESEMTPAELLF